MKLSDYDEKDRMSPDKGKKAVYLVKVPEYVVGKDDANDSIVFTFKDKNKDAEAQFSVYDIFNQKADLNPKIARANNSRITSLFKAFMIPENQEKFGKYDLDTYKGLYDAGIALLAEDALNVEATILCGYNPQGGSYLQLPTFGSCISTKYRERNLEFDPTALSLTIKAKKGKGGAGKPDEDSNDSVEGEDL